jgi:Protein of unknown function (DUF3302)
MDVTFGPLDAFAFVVFAVILAVVVVIVVSLGKLPGQLARKWGHPQAAAINVTSWIGVATGGLLWPVALIWAFIVPSKSTSFKIEDDHEKQRAVGPSSVALKEPSSQLTAEEEEQP